LSATAAAGAMIVSGLAIAGAVSPTAYAAKAGLAARHHQPANTCHLAHGIKHVIQIGFDNVHYYRDNPNVPSDLELMPNLLNFIEGNGTMLTNNHTPLIAHTADDLLTTATGLYGDRHGDPIANSNRSYNTNGTTSLASDFAYWTDAIPNGNAAGQDANPNMVYSPVPPATARNTVAPDKVAPAPWVPFTKAGCNVGEVATANQDLENTTPDIADLFGPNSPEAQQLAADKDSFKDPETADYVGIAVHCAKHNSFCADAQAVKFGQTTPSNTEVPDLLPQQPGGYNGFDMVLGHRYVAPELGAGTPNVMHNGFEVTNAAGNLVGLDGNQINGAFLTNHPGFPGFGSINAAQTLAYAADMLENGVPVVNMYIADIHGNEDIPSLTGPGGPCAGLGSAALGSGSACYIAQGQFYNQQFGTFFQRLASDGITPKNTLFVLSSDEGDHEVGANVGRAIQPTPANCDGAKVSGDTVTSDVLCTYPAGSFGELAGNINGMLTAAGNTTPFTLENDTAPEFYVTGQPTFDTSSVRSLEHLAAGLTNNNPYTGTNQTIDNFLADPTEEAILHMVNADPRRTPTFAMFAKPDYFLINGNSTCSGSCVTQSTGFAYDHGAYAAEINTNYVGFAGPGVRHLGLDGNAPGDGPNSAGADSGQTEVFQTHLKGPWTDETDIRPTIMYVTDLRENYVHDGRVISQIVSRPNHALRARGATLLGECYKQLNSSVGRFGAFTLAADTNAINSSSAGDATYLGVVRKLHALEVVRDRLAVRIKNALDAAEFGNHTIRHIDALIVGCIETTRAAHRLANHS